MKSWILIGALAALAIFNQLSDDRALAAQSAKQNDSGSETPDVEPLDAGDRQGLKGELGCSFADADNRILLAGMGYVADSGAPTGVIRIAGVAVAMKGKKGGGYEALVAGPVFVADDGVSAKITRAPKQVPEDGAENSKWKASLSVAVDGGGSASFEDGLWTCGP